jgi:hypothetical protein
MNRIEVGQWKGKFRLIENPKEVAPTDLKALYKPQTYVVSNQRHLQLVHLMCASTQRVLIATSLGEIVHFGRIPVGATRF